METKIYDLSPFDVNERNGTYGGKAGDKEGITINGEYWIVKYPKSTKGMKGDLDSYTTSPLSEYIGSHIYHILGIDAHETMLGVRNGKLVVACKDFCKNEGSLREIRTLKNIYNEELSRKLEESISSTSEDAHFIPIEVMMTHLQYNPILQSIPDIQNRFWEQFIVDMLINNNDRNNGNWGVLYENGNYRLAPVFDNGAAFSNKVPDRKLAIILSDEKSTFQSIASCTSVYTDGGHHIHGKDMVKINDEGFMQTARNLVPVIENRMNEIRDFINDIPEKCNDMEICSNVRKQFYIKSMELKLANYLMPVLKLARDLQNNQEEDKTSCIHDKKKINRKSNYPDLD